MTRDTPHIPLSHHTTASPAKKQDATNRHTNLSHQWFYYALQAMTRGALPCHAHHIPPTSSSHPLSVKIAIAAQGTSRSLALHVPVRQKAQHRRRRDWGVPRTSLRRRLAALQCMQPRPATCSPPCASLPRTSTRLCRRSRLVSVAPGACAARGATATACTSPRVGAAPASPAGPPPPRSTTTRGAV